jgi:hypothetical protein
VYRMFIKGSFVPFLWSMLGVLRPLPMIPLYLTVLVRY